MNVLRSIGELALLPGPLHLAIGVFDGVHLGHRAVVESAILAAAKKGGTGVVVTFDPHPATVLRPGRSPALLTSTRHKLRLLAGIGATHTLVVPFDPVFAATPPEDFIAALAAACRPLGTICVGENWAFGKGRSGDIALLREIGAKLGFGAIGIPNVSVDGQAASSTAIRNALQAGDLRTAARLLGRDFGVFGTVISGERRGRTLGFPTANFRPEAEQLPPNGVYAVRVAVNGDLHPGVANIGVRPTVEPSGSETLVEAHLFDFSGDLYGGDLEVHFVRFLRPEQKFASLDALKAQIATDAATARETLRRW